MEKNLTPGHDSPPDTHKQMHSVSTFNKHAQLAIVDQPPSKSMVVNEIITVAYHYSPRQIMYLLKPPFN